jgi:hypothetical protein
MVIGTDDEFLSIPKAKELFRMIPSKLKKIRFATGSHTEIRLESLIEQIVDFANGMGKKFKYVQGMDIALPTNVKELGQSTKSGNAVMKSKGVDGLDYGSRNNRKGDYFDKDSSKFSSKSGKGSKRTVGAHWKKKRRDFTESDQNNP